jgi:hypothetical protein
MKTQVSEIIILEMISDEISKKLYLLHELNQHMII